MKTYIALVHTIVKMVVTMVVSIYNSPTHKVSIIRKLPDLFTEFITNIDTINVTVIDKQRVVVILHARVGTDFKMHLR